MKHLRPLKLLLLSAVLWLPFSGSAADNRPDKKAGAASSDISLLPATVPARTLVQGYIGGRIDDCIRVRVMGQDEDALVEPFRHREETHRWQSEFWGKWTLGAVASYRYNRDPALLAKIENGVKGLLATQTPDGYIGNYAPERQLAEWDVWGRKYVMLGLLAYYDLSGDKKALRGACRVADHLMTQVGPGKTDIAATGNYHGMASCSVLEPITALYVRTGDKRYLDFALYIADRMESSPDGPALISKALAGTDVAARFPHPGNRWFSPINGQKAYEMMSCYEGLLALYRITGEPSYKEAVEATVRNIAATEINIAGSGSAFECFYYGKERQTEPAYHTMETCVTMTWMKLCGALLALEREACYADLIEQTLCNALLASMKDDASQISQYSPLEGEHFAGVHQCGMPINCCNANGPRAFALIPELVTTVHGDELFVNLYGPSASQTTVQGIPVGLRQNTSYPEEGRIEIEIEPEKQAEFTVAIRIPEWSERTKVTVKGEELPVDKTGYLKIRRQWQAGDKIGIELDMRGRLIKQNGCQAIRRGPVVLARDSRFGDGFVDECAVVEADEEGVVELSPMPEKPAGMWMAFTAPMMLGSNREGAFSRPRPVALCDFASAGNTWDRATRYKVWLTETLNVINAPYIPYNKTE